jgi:hypothetical protein
LWRAVQPSPARLGLAGIGAAGRSPAAGYPVHVRVAGRLKGAQTRSCSSAVLVQQTAEQVAPTHSALLILGDNGRPGGLIWWLEPERPVRAVVVVMADVDLQDPLEVATADDQEPVQALGADRADPSLGGRVRLGVCTGVTSTSTPSERNTSSKLRQNFASRSCSRKRTYCPRSPSPSSAGTASLPGEPGGSMPGGDIPGLPASSS